MVIRKFSAVNQSTSFLFLLLSMRSDDNEIFMLLNMKIYVPYISEMSNYFQRFIFRCSYM